MTETATFKHKAITEKILSVFFKKVYHTLGYGVLEKVYEYAMALELRCAGLRVEQQAKIDGSYAGEIVGEYFADLLVDNAVIVELKATKAISEDHEAQLLNYLRATPYEVGLLLNFGPKAEFRHKAYDNERKTAAWLK
ncbi:MAG: GxxExxY protein [Chloroflexi bacterium]|nr:GxxExxY protein [Chloroflexota bacterium]